VSREGGEAKRSVAASALEQIVDLEVPRSLILAPTFRCPLRCRHCDLPLHASAELDQELWRRRICELAREVRRPLLVGISGGEPLLHPGLHLIVKTCAEVGFFSAMVTSGAPLHAETIAPLLSQGLTALVVSLDGRAEVHDDLRRRPGLHDHAVRAMQEVRALSPGLSITIVTTVMDATVEDLVPLAHRVTDVPWVNSVCFHTLSANLGSAAEFDPGWYSRSPLWPRDAPALRAALEQLIALSEAGAPLVNTPDQLRAMLSFYEAPQRQLRPCDQHSGGLMILPDGTVKICPVQDAVGSIVEQPIAEIWRSAPAQALRQAMTRCERNCHFMTNFGYQRHELGPGEPEASEAPEPSEALEVSEAPKRPKRPKRP
jgi:MoaA/NifB/PqqE/SkfB family radical SAM enzyme